jgi:hypothetical protein
VAFEVVERNPLKDSTNGPSLQTNPSEMFPMRSDSSQRLVLPPPSVIEFPPFPGLDYKRPELRPLETPKTIAQVGYEARQVLDRPLGAPEEVQKELLSVFGRDNLARVKEGKDFSFEKIVHSKQGDVKLNVLYRAAFNDLGSSDATLFANKVTQIVNYEKTTKMLAEMTGEADRRVDVGEKYFGNAGTFVNQATFKTAPIDATLATAGINTCAGLVVIDRAHEKQYLAHIDSTISPEQIKKSLRGVDLSQSEIYVMEGTTPSGTVQNILTALSDDPKALKNLKFLHPTADGLFNSVAVSGGKVYLAGDTTGWNKTGLSQFEK